MPSSLQASSTGESFLQLRGLVVRRGSREVLHGLDLDVRRGEILGLLGPNGCGKSTLFHTLTGLLRPRRGTITLSGCALHQKESAFLASTGVVFQNPALDLRFSARENLVMAARLYGVKAAEARCRAEKLLKHVGLSKRADDRVATFSGGMRRRVEIARALIHEPNFLILDEPTTGLDEAAFRQVWSDLMTLRRECGLTVLFTTHRADEAEQCDRVAILDKGRIVTCDTPDALRATVRGDLLWLEGDDLGAMSRQLDERLGLESKIMGERLAIRLDEAHRWVPRIAEALADFELRSLEMRRTGLAEVFLERTGHRLDEGDTE